MDVEDLAPPPSAMCATCKVQLIPITHGPIPGEDGPVMLLEYRHPPTTNADHVPAPVPLGSDTINRCDFCSEIGEVPWQLECTPFRHENYQDDGAWGACDACVELIRSDDWDGMRARVERLVARVGGDARIESALGLQAAFRHHFTGQITGP